MQTIGCNDWVRWASIMEKWGNNNNENINLTFQNRGIKRLDKSTPDNNDSYNLKLCARNSLSANCFPSQILHGKHSLFGLPPWLRPRQMEFQWKKNDDDLFSIVISWLVIGWQVIGKGIVNERLIPFSNFQQLHVSILFFLLKKKRSGRFEN